MISHALLNIGTNNNKKGAYHHSRCSQHFGLSEIQLLHIVRKNYALKPNKFN